MRVEVASADHNTRPPCASSKDAFSLNAKATQVSKVLGVANWVQIQPSYLSQYRIMHTRGDSNLLIASAAAVVNTLGVRLPHQTTRAHI